MTHKEIVSAVEKDSTLVIIQRQVDGNYKGWAQKNNKVIQERQINPEYTLQALLTKSVI